MTNETSAFTLACRNGRGQPPVLRDVAAAARLDGTLFELTLRQTYRNAGTDVLEVVYTFPLLPRGVLLSFATELNGARMAGTILPRRQAEAQYENALADGDAPVMLEAHADGLHTANIGNLKPGDEIVVEVRMAQVAALEQGRLRLVVPSTIAPRYGDPASAGLQPQQAPVASVHADYPLAFTLQVSGALADAPGECPTHRVVSRRTEAGLQIALAPEARLDRDVVLVVTPASPADAVVTQARDPRSADAPIVLLATLPVPEAAPRDGIALKLLVDCSGSMGGDSIASARRALQGIAAGLAAADAVSFTRFGSTVEQLGGLAPCTPAALATLARHIDKTDANLGGTEMKAALASVFAIPARAKAGDGLGDVLMITDGEVWDVEAIIETARRAAHRVFVIGVGSSPAEGPLRRLAQATGGACEFATPGEALEAAAQRMLARMRQHAWTDLRIDWGAEAAWQGELPLAAFAGDTLAVFAGVRGEPAAGAPVRLISRSAAGVDIVLASAPQRSLATDDALPRVAAAGRLAALDTEAATLLAVAYQLMSPHTNCVLVHQRAEADKAVDEAQLHRVEGMLAAGWGAMGSVMASGPADAMDMMAALPARTRSAAPMARAAAPKMFTDVAPVFEADAAMPAPASLERLRSAAPGHALKKPAPPRLSPLGELAQALVDHFRQRGSIRALVQRCRTLGAHAQVLAAVGEVVALGVPDAAAWTLLAFWLDERLGTTVAATFPDSARLRAARTDAALAASAHVVFDRALGDLAQAATWPAALA